MNFTIPNRLKRFDLAHRIGWLLFQPYKWLIYVPFLGLSTVILGGMSVVIATLANPRLAGKLCAVPWARLNAFVGMMSVAVSGRENIDPQQSYVVVANHQSLFDIFVIYGWLETDLRWVMKQELRAVPVLGYCCEKLEHIYIDRSNKRAAIASLNAAKDKIVNGTSILFFPEGTRSKTGELLPFKKGAFRMALAAQRPILPITVVGTREVLPSGTLDLLPGRARLVIHQPIPTEGYGPSKVGELMQMTRERINSALV